ncbi:MAG: hypothetical protein H7A46_25500 [Verrucomicrobiales bacterium]|nr:hypothetical protein [Verrucomicrobiales bacterium]
MPWDSSTVAFPRRTQPGTRKGFDLKLFYHHAGFVKMTVDLPAELVQAVKLRAVMERRPVKECIAEVLRVGLGLQAAGNERAPGGLPVFRCRADAPARAMTAERLIALEHQCQVEEDLRRAGHSV